MRRLLDECDIHWLLYLNADLVERMQKEGIPLSLAPVVSKEQPLEIKQLSTGGYFYRMREQVYRQDAMVQSQLIQRVMATVRKIDIEKKMKTFVTGILERNEVGATDGYTIYDRWLTLRLSNGIALRIFDEELISTDLEVGLTYDMILVVAVPDTIRYRSAPPENVDLDAIDREVVELRGSEGTFVEYTYVVRGTVVEPSWQAPQCAYRCMVPYLPEFSAVLVQTAIGRVLIHHLDIEEDMEGSIEQIKAGGYLEWERSRLSLLAVL